MSGTSWEIGRLPPAEEIARLMREARRMRSQAVAAMAVAAGRALMAGLRHWFHRQPTAPFAGNLSGRAR